jgi:hypothetical protein
MWMMGRSNPSSGDYLGAALLACGIAWLWDFILSLYFPGKTALNLTIVSALVYLEAAFLGAFGLARRMSDDRVRIGMRVGIWAFLLNAAFRLILFDLFEALWGVILYLISFTLGGLLGGLFARMILGEVEKNEPRL